MILIFFLSGRVVDWSIDGLKTASGASGIEIDYDDLGTDKQTMVRVHTILSKTQSLLLIYSSGSSSTKFVLWIQTFDLSLLLHFRIMMRTVYATVSRLQIIHNKVHTVCGCVGVGGGEVGCHDIFIQ